jgi:hypothetical protein
MFLSVVVTPPDVEIQKHLTSLHIVEWVREDVFQFKWWLLLILLAVSLYAWWKTIDKSRLPEILLYAALTTIIIMAINEFGNELTLWDYPTDIIPIFPPLTSLNLTSLTLIYSLIYQRFKTYSSFIRATLIITVVICFAIEPILSFWDLYTLLKWQYYYGYPIYVLTAICVRAAVIKIKTLNDKSSIKNLG